LRPSWLWTSRTSENTPSTTLVNTGIGEGMHALTLTIQAAYMLLEGEGTMAVRLVHQYLADTGM
jgi:hypothetical protein